MLLLRGIEENFEDPIQFLYEGWTVSEDMARWTLLTPKRSVYDPVHGT